VNWAGLSEIFAHVDVRWVALSSALTVLIIAALALRWSIFLRQQKIALPYGTVLSLTWAGQFFNSVLPGSTGGDVVKVYQVCRLAPDRKAAAASTVFVDRLSALLALLVLAGAAVLYDPKPLLLIPRVDLPVDTLLFVGLLLAAVGILGFWVGSRLLRGTKLHGRIKRTLAAALSALTLSRTSLAGIILAFGIHLLNFVTIYFFARALGIPLTYLQIALMMPVVLLLLLAPITINGHGLREVLLIGYLGYMGVVVPGHSGVDARETAIALSMLAVATDLLWSIPGGVFYLMRFRTSASSADLPA
jgi:hypothetical protein